MSATIFSASVLALIISGFVLLQIFTLMSAVFALEVWGVVACSFVSSAPPASSAGLALPAPSVLSALSVSAGAFAFTPSSHPL